MHPNKYDISHVKFINWITKIELECEFHGKFSITPAHLKEGKGCRECGIIKRVKSQSKPIDEFIAQANEVHDFKYDYSKAVYNGIHNVVRAKNGDLYVSDTRNNLIRKIDGKTNLVSTIAGIPGKKGFSGDGGPAVKAQLADPISISLSLDERTLLIADIHNKRIRGIDLKTGIIKTLAGNGKKGKPKAGEKATEQPLADPRASVMDAKGNLYVLERNGNALRIVRPDGRIFTVAGTGKKGTQDGPAKKATFSGPKHLCIDPQGKVIIADDNNHLIRLYDPKTKTVSTILGGDAEPKTKLNRPHGVAIAPDGSLWVCDSWNNRVLILRNYQK